MSDDRFKMVYEELQPEQLQLIKDIKGLAGLLSVSYAKVANREMALALTNLEQSIMWAVKAVCVDYARIKQQGEQA
jgi:hypothetical protein